MDQIYESEQGLRWTTYDRLSRKREAYEGFTMAGLESRTTRGKR
jgi:hypothetical protein